ncbi:MAG: DUF1489 family protein [Alphaproteobacteria bacterium]|nr:DUF1489 family protein [Alphaproteobacteria bacterium]
MPLHLIKMAVGVDDVATLAAWQRRRRSEAKARGDQPVTRHLTRNTPRRGDEILDGGSLYWVFRGQVQVRQKIVGITTAENAEGEKRCAIMLAARLHRVVPRRHRPFQGWRYLDATLAPPDIADMAAGPGKLPPALAAELRDLGLI